MASKAKSRTLTDHAEIRRWAAGRSARPSTVRRIHRDDNSGMIRLDFPGYSGAETLEEISWEEWFEDFEDRNLALIVQDEVADGERSNFNRLIPRESGESESERSRGAGRGTSGRRSESQTAKKTGSGPPATASSKSRSSRPRRSRERKTAERNRSSRRKAASTLS